MKFVCQFAYLYCEGSGLGLTIAAPSEASCTAGFDSCIPSDAPPTVRTAIQTTFAAVFQSVDGTSQNCAQFYANFRAQLGSLANFVSYNNLIPQFDLVPDCQCSIPANLTTCNGIVDYPVWKALLALNQTIESGVRDALFSITTSLDAISGASCANCYNQLQSTFCTAGFYRCSNTTGSLRLFVPPCKSVCDDALRSCRIDQLAAPAMLGLIRNVSTPATVTLIQQTVSNCSQDPFSPVDVNSTTLITTAGEDFHLRTFNSNASLACHDGTYTPKAKCACVSASVPTVCSTHVTYPVWGPINSLVSPQLANLGTQLDPLKTICQNCYLATARAVCTASFPKCDSDNVIIPSCPSDCRNQISSCNVTAFQSQCDSISSQLPFNASDFGSNCFNSGTPYSSCSSFCTPISSTSVCASYVTWPVFSLMSTYQSQIDLLMSQALSTTSYPNCAGCETNMKKMYCSTLYVPCTPAGVDKLVGVVLNGGVDLGNPASIFPKLDQPCYDECRDTTAGCYTTLAQNPSALLTCNTSSILGFSFGGPLTSTSATCYRHNFGTMPPSTCTVVRAVPKAAAPTAGTSNVPTSGGSSAPSDSNLNNTSGGVHPAAIAVPIVLVVLIAAGAVVAVLYVKKMWIFKIHKPDPRMFEG